MSRKIKPQLGKTPDSPALFYIKDLAEILGVNAFFIHKFFREKGFPCRNLPGMAFKVMYASVFCKFHDELMEAIHNVRDDRNTRDNPDRIPTIQNMLYRDPKKPPLSKQEREDISRRIFASSKLECVYNTVYVAGIYRVNYYKDGSMSIDHYRRFPRMWDRVTPIFRKELFVDYVLEFDLILHDTLED